MRIYTSLLTAAFFTRISVFLLGGVVSACASGSDPRGDEIYKAAVLNYERHAETHAALRNSGVSATLNRFMLTKKNDQACAFRFTSFRRDGKFVPSSYFTMGGYETFAEYEWHFQGDGSFDLSKPNVQSGKGKLRWGPDTRIGHGLILTNRPEFNRGLMCGSFLIPWNYPMHLSFNSYVNNDSVWDPKREMAPTRWDKIHDVDFRNPKLRS